MPPGLMFLLVARRGDHADRAQACVETARPRRESAAWMAVGVACEIAMNEGFFGPGTGTFLIVAYASIWRDSLDAASANAKVVNFASNLAAMTAFAAARDCPGGAPCRWRRVR